MIGRVTSSGQSDTMPFKTVQVEPYADLNAVDAVAVLIPNGRRR
jgi:cell shape-determining protein MreC